MKYLIFIPRMGGGGAERVVSNVSSSLVSNGDTVFLTTIVGGESFYPLHSKVNYDSVGVTVNRKNKLFLLFTEFTGLIRSFFYLRKKIRSVKPDAVLSFQKEPDIICYLIKKTRVKFCHICSERNDPFVRSALDKWILQRVYGDSALLICQSKAVSDFYSSAKIKTIIPNPIDPKIIPPRISPVDGRIVAVGRLDVQKNFSLLIQSFALIKKSYPNCILDIYGEGYLRNALQSEIDSLDLSNSITLHGAQKNIAEIIANATLFVMSSDYEGFPNALLEALAIGIPLVSTDFKTGTAREMIGKENGLLVPVGDKNAMADAILRILSDSKLRDQMSASNKEKAKMYYNDIIMTKWIDALGKCVNDYSD